MRPSSPLAGPLRGGVLFVHGHGEYAARYEEVFSELVDDGWVVMVPDLPGHGLSDGKRGHLKSFDELAAIYSTLQDELRQVVGPDGSICLGGHSMGGLVAAWLVVRKVVSPDAVWMGSPLLSPTHNKPWWLVQVAKALDVLLPRMVISSGVNESHCYALEVGDSPALRPDVDPHADKFDHEEVVHRWISMRLGVELMRAAECVWDGVPQQWPSNVPLFFTQGAEDPVCPAAIARKFCNQLASDGRENVLYHELPGALHEPHRDAKCGEMLACVFEFFNRSIALRDAAASAPSPNS